MSHVYSLYHEKLQLLDATESVSCMSESKNKNNKKTITLYTIIAFLAFVFIYSQYMGGLNTSGLSGGLSLYIAFSFWLHFLAFVSVVFLVIYFIERILVRRRKLQLVLFAVTGALFTIYLYVDSKIYSIMNLHLNRFVIESLAQEDILNEMGVSPKLLIVSVMPILFFLSAHFLISPLSRFTVATVSFGRRNVVILFFISKFLLPNIVFLF